MRRWSMLVIALTATLFANVFINGAAFLIPTLHTERGLDLAKAGLLSSMPSFGMVFTLIAWGYVVDRVGERVVLARRLGVDRGRGVRGGIGALAGRGRRLSASSAEWRRQAATPPAAGWWSAGSRRNSAAWSWASGRRPSRWESAWARW